MYIYICISFVAYSMEKTESFKTRACSATLSV